MGIFIPRQEILTPLGLVTQPSKYAQYPAGACSIAKNVVMRNPGELIQAPDVQGVQVIGGANTFIRKLAPLNDGHVYTFADNGGTTWSLTETNNAVTFPGSAVNAFNSSAVSWARVAERLIVNGNFGNLVGDFMAPSSAGQRALREAGMQQPSIAALAFVNSGYGYFGGDQMVGYTACLVREFADGYTVRSVPAAAVKVWQGTGAAVVDVDLIVFWTTGITVAGDILELYRTDVLLTPDANADPGATFKRVLRHVVSAGEAASGNAHLVDWQPPVAGTQVTPGEELYSNPAQEGATNTNRRPPIARSIASFKGFAFYGYTTERPQFRFTVAGGFGADIEAVAAGVTVEAFKRHGVGTRTGAGTITNGSAVITAVSPFDMLGIQAGQVWAGSVSQWPGFTTTVLSVTGTTITMSAPASSGGASWAIADVLEIDGVKRPMSDAATFINNLAGAYEITCTQPIALTFPRFMQAFDFTLETNRHPLNATMTIRGTSNVSYSPPIQAIAASVGSFGSVIRKNRIQWSKEQQPEHAPPSSEAFIGFAELYALNATRDAVWIWCSDGLFRLSGDSGALGLGNWQVDYANSSLLLAGNEASTVLGEYLYAYTNIGFVEIDSAGNVANLTDKVIGDLLPGRKYDQFGGHIVVECNETDEEVLLMLGEHVGAYQASSKVYVFNVKQRGWTTLEGNGANLSFITTAAMQRYPSSGEPRTLFARSDALATAPSYSGWNSASAFLTSEVQYQPIYGDDPLEVKRWLWADYLFDALSNGKTIIPTWNGTQFGGSVGVQSFDQGGYARAGCPREVGTSQSISAGFRALAGAPQSHFQGLSIPLKQRTNQSKKR